MVMGGVACPRGCEFDSHCHMLDGSSLLTFFVVLMFKKTENGPQIVYF